MALTADTVPAPFRRQGHHLVIDLPGARALFTTRAGGVSAGPYASLNLGLLTEDRAEAVRANRATLEAEHDVRLGFVHQVHGADVRRLSADTAERERAGGVSALVKADGQITTEPGLAAVTLTADCLPVAIAAGGAVAMVHAGWRGLRAGVIASGIAALRAAGAGGPLAAAIGPGAGPCCFEVGDEVHEAFADHPSAVHAGRCLDLPGIARHQLSAAGVTEVHAIGLCTICSDPADFFSHRRDHGVTGRQAGIAWRRD